MEQRHKIIKKKDGLTYWLTESELNFVVSEALKNTAFRSEIWWYEQVRELILSGSFFQ